MCSKKAVRELPICRGETVGSRRIAAVVAAVAAAAAASAGRRCLTAFAAASI